MCNLIFAKRLAELRKEYNLSQNALASKLGYSRGQIGNYELGSREPDFSTLIKIADFFNVSIDYLIGKTNTRHFELDSSLEELIVAAEKLSAESIDYLKKDAELLQLREKLQKDKINKFEA